MTLRRQLPFAFFAALLSIAPVAHAQTEEDPEPEVADQGPETEEVEAIYDRVLSLGLTGGLDTPFGLVGGYVEFAPWRYVAFYAGGGIGRDGGRFAGGVHGRYPIGHAAVGLMLGVGGGALGWESGGDEMFRIRRHWDMAMFFHGGITFEYRWDEGVFGRLGFGVDGHMTPGAADSCTEAAASNGGEEMPMQCGPAGDGLAKPIRGWAGLTIGYALDL